MKGNFLGDIPAHSYRKTKIIATVGPASRSPERVRELIQAGVNVFRLNFSHGSHEEHLESLTTIRQAAVALNAPVAVLQDLSGPKIRISNVEGDYATVKDDDQIDLFFADTARAVSPNVLSTGTAVYVETVNPIEVLQPNHTVLLADGIISLVTEEVKKDRVTCRILKGGRIRSRVGIAFPDSHVNLPATTKKDFHDLNWGIKNAVDYVAVSFVKSAEDIRMIKEVVENENGDIRIISKIERKEALDNIYEIIEASDGLMVARGDLGLEFPLERLPRIQKKLIEESNARGIPAIVATQMLHSMITSVRPTRAEVSDIATAVMSGADAVMLSEETAIGENPVEAVRYLSRIAHEAERSFDFDEYKIRLRDTSYQTVPDAVSYAACAAAVKVGAAAIIACTETGTSARLVAKYRPQQPLYGISTRQSTLNRMALNWGVIPISFDQADTHFDEIETALKTVQRRENLTNGSRAVITGGLSVRTPGSTSIMEIKEMNYL